MRSTLVREMVVRSPHGLHLRAAGTVAKVASQFESMVLIQYKDTCVNGKSVMGLASLGVLPGSTVTVIIEGSDVNRAMEALDVLFRSAFDERAVLESVCEGSQPMCASAELAHV